MDVIENVRTITTEGNEYVNVTDLVAWLRDVLHETQEEKSRYNPVGNNAHHFDGQVHALQRVIDSLKGGE